MKKFPSLLIVTVAATISVVSYQNCSGFSPMKLDASSLDGSGGSTTSLGGTLKSNPFTCDGATTGVEPLRRLTKLELVNSLKALLGTGLYGDVADSVGALYSDQVSKNVSEFSNSISDVQMNGYQNIADRIYSSIVAQPTRLTSAGFSCVANEASNVTATCKSNSIRRAGLLAFRRPLTSAEYDRFANQIWTQGANGPESMGWVLYGLVLSKDFLLHLELGASATSNDTYDLTPYEVASRLSFMIADSPPDDALYVAAAAGELATLDQLKPHVDRLVMSTGGRDKIRSFFNYYLLPRNFAANSFASDFAGTIDVAAFSSAANSELREYIDYMVFTKKASFVDLITSRETFPRNSDLGSIYGAARTLQVDASADSTPTTTSVDRMGLLMRSPVIGNDGNDTHPILRGAKFRSRFLCQSTGLPAGALLAGDVSFSGDAARTQYSVRYRTEQLTGSTTCMACHSSINPLGFALEGFDALGRPRKQEQVFSSTGSLLATHPIDSSVTIDATSLGGAAEMIDKFSKDNRLPACFSNQMSRYYRLRPESAADSCALRDVYQSMVIDPNASVLEGFKRQALTPGIFKRRKQ